MSLVDRYLAVHLESLDWNSAFLVHVFSTVQQQSSQINILILAYLNSFWCCSVDIQVYVFITLKDLSNIKVIYLQIDALNTVYMLSVLFHRVAIKV